MQQEQGSKAKRRARAEARARAVEVPPCRLPKAQGSHRRPKAVVADVARPKGAAKARPKNRGQTQWMVLKTDRKDPVVEEPAERAKAKVAAAGSRRSRTDAEGQLRRRLGLAITWRCPS